MSERITDFCENAICHLKDGEAECCKKQDILPNRLQQLQESLRTLCVTCLPLRPFPLIPTSPLPIVFELPRTSSKLHTGCSKPLSQRVRLRPVNKGCNSVSSGVEEGNGEDDASFLSADLDESSSLGRHDADSNVTCPKIFKYTKQERSNLEKNYTHLFREFHGIRKFGVDEVTTPLWCNTIRLEARRISGVIPFVKIAFPEFVLPDLWDKERNFNRENRVSVENTVIHRMFRCYEDAGYGGRIVYDLDQLISMSKNFSAEKLDNEDIDRIGKLDSTVDHLIFESRFEGGNLRRATEVGFRHYELVLSADLNEKKPHFQWFYFEISNIEAGVPYTFEIINCLKNTSMFSSGMQPVVFSVAEYLKKGQHWVRAGSSICYYRNFYTSPSSASTDSLTGKKKGNSKKTKASFDGRCYFTTKFDLIFENSGDICYIAYHYPYTYSFLQASLSTLIKRARVQNRDIYATSDCLCYSLAGNPVPIVTVTSAGNADELEKRDVVIFFARVHPGESNSSWIMHGVLEFLLSANPEAIELCKQFIFKLVPMLNPDGVINGSHRCSLAGVDLNRVWDQPCPAIHPAIFHAKGVIQYLIDILGKPPLVVVDFHGHSRRFNVFMYGNDPSQSWRHTDHYLEHGSEFRFLPEILAKNSWLFSLSDCGFKISRGKESSARVVLWRQFHLRNVYTMEASYCGFDFGKCAGDQVNISHMKQVGRSLCESVGVFKKRFNLEMYALAS